MAKSMSKVPNPLSASVWRDRGLDYIRARDYKRASEVLEKAVDINPDDAFSLMLLGGLRVVLGAPNAALCHLEKAHKLDRGNAIILRFLGTAWRQMSDSDDAALDVLSRAVEMKPDDVLSLILRGDTHMLLQRYADADADLCNAEAGMRGEASCVIFALRGGCKRMLGEYEEAARLLRKAYDLEGKNKFILNSYGDVLNRLGRYERAASVLDHAIISLPNDAAMSCALYGETHKMYGAYFQALGWLNDAVGLKPNDAYFLALRGDIKRMLGNYEGALADLDRADDIEPDNVFTLKIRGTVKGRLGRFEEALADLNRAVLGNPNDTFTLARHREIQKENTCGCYSAICKGVREVIKRICGKVVEAKALAPLPDIKASELCDLNAVIIEWTLAELSR
jgi:tetratricopeptide (TPR) repeat protein